MVFAYQDPFLQSLLDLLTTNTRLRLPLEYHRDTGGLSNKEGPLHKRPRHAPHPKTPTCLACACALLFSLGAPLVLCAQQPPVNEVFDEAAADYMAKRYDKAAVGFRKAYALLPEALFLYNQAKALQKLGNWDAAVGALERARDQVERPLPPELSAKVPDMMAELKASQRAEEQIKSAERVEVVSPAAQPASSFGPIGWAGIGGVTVGAGLLMAGGLIASGVSDEAERLRTEVGQNRAQFEASRQAALDDQSLARVLFFSGAGLALTGGTLLAWELLSDDERPHEGARLTAGPMGMMVEATW